MSRKNSVAIATPSLAVRKTVWTSVAAAAIRFCNQAAGVLTGPISVEVATTGRTSAAVATGQAAAAVATGQAAAPVAIGQAAAEAALPGAIGQAAAEAAIGQAAV